jgi:cytochrome c-type biogenesis protein
VIGQLFGFLSNILGGSIELALAAAFGWGVLSILLSPCHLSGIPLIIGFISTQGRVSVKRSFLLSSIFALGVLVTIAAIGLATAYMGRLIGDVGFTGNLIVAAVLILIGLYLLDIIRPRWEGVSLQTNRRGGLAALGLGLLFGVGLGPCTFAYMAPVLGVVFQISQSNVLAAYMLLLMFGLGHTAVIVAAGTSTRWVQVYLDWSDDSKAVTVLRRACGALVVAGGAYLMVQSLWP